MKNWTFVKFEPKKVLVIDCTSAREILEKRAMSTFKATVNLGLKTVEVKISNNKAIIGEFYLDLKDLGNIASNEEDIYCLNERGLSKLVMTGEHFYRLRRVPGHAAPTLEIDGNHMHRIEGTTPWEDAREKILRAGVKTGHKVLDTCTGLGYTAIHSALAGAEVLTVEIDANVIELATYNPWSWELSNPRIKMILGDVCEVIKDLENENFDRVIHDPPRFSARTGDLYGRELYSDFYRVLKKGGVLLHYVGSPGKARGLDLARSVARRLQEVGFETRMLREVEAVLATKTRSVRLHEA